jgi:PAS domain S-box-containing protein
MVNNIKDYAIIHLDAEGCVATWNSGAQYIKGYTEEDVIGKPISIFYTPEEIAAGKPKRDLQLALQHEQHKIRQAGRNRSNRNQKQNRKRKNNSNI